MIYEKGKLLDVNIVDYIFCHIFQINITILCVVNQIHGTEGLSKDGLALLDFKNGLISTGTALGSWRASDALPCNWEGVNCSGSAGLVTSLYLPSAGLVGPISPSLGKLEGLQNLTLSDNMLSGSIPSELGNCTNLITLALDQNNLTGEIPAQLGNCTSLQVLAIQSNQLNGSLIPKELGQLPYLVVLDLRDNSFSGTIPPELGNISTLQSLLLSTNNLTGPIPQELGNLTSLIDLHLYQNELTGPLPEELGNLHNLAEMLVYSNHLNGTIPPSLGVLNSLSTFDVHNNSMSGSIPAELFNCLNLTTLDMSDNEFFGQIPPEIGQLTNLSYLGLYDNHFSGPIPEQLENLTVLQQLLLSNNSFSGSLPMGLANLLHLTNISLYDNHLSGPLPSKLGMLSNLTVLDVTNNAFNGTLPTGLCQNSCLRILDIQYNNFDGPIPMELTNCGSLVRMRAGFNSLTSIPNYFGRNSNLQYLELSSNYLHGALPLELGLGSALSTLKLDNNRFFGNLSSELVFSNLPNLQVLNLSSNQFVGPIPPSLVNCTNLFILDLSYNFFNGSIPQAFPIELGNLQNVQVLDLSHNQLSGTIPPTLGTQLVSLESVNVSYNDLNGSLPSSWIRFLTSNYDSFVGNPGLCLIYSRDGQCSTNPLHSGKKKITTHVVVAIVVSSIVFILGFGLLTYCYFLKSSKDTMVALSNIEVVSSPGREISFNNIMEATQNLSSDYIIGIGGHGTVYKAIMFDGSVVAVKKIPLLQKDLQIHKSFLREINTIGNVKHRNLAKLLGFCKWGEIGLLIYDYIPNGDLHEALHNKVNDVVLNWDTRLKIAEGIAHGLAYLHHDCVPPIIHRDIKSRNVLLDANLEAHIVDFGIAKTMSLKPKDDVSTTTVVEGTYGYIAPEYGYGGQVTPKVDVYSFGVVLLELLTGKQPIDPSFCESEHIIPWVLSTIGQNGLTFDDNVLDPRLLDTSTNLQKAQMFHVIKIALLCTKTAPSDRLTMVQVVEFLRRSQYL
ncbi:unnamed protein product [Sphagnum jensenii]|uniref:Protein kinase domain-containing protein n=1 Tax=Sphagnum jensenii TaxID=128206 RepID=A0ABP0WCS9_9BRYO